MDSKLIELLRSLQTEEWDLPTIVPRWSVRHVAAHLLDTQLRKLSIVRDGFMAERPAIQPASDLVSFINRLNGEGVAVYSRLSPPVLLSLLEWGAAESADFHESLDPVAPALFSVGWAGEDRSLNWFDTARELTERWHHQQQIRLAVGKPGIMTPELYGPVLDCFFRALPHTYRSVNAEEGTLLQFQVSGDCGGFWFLVREHSSWRLSRMASGRPSARITVPQEIAWRIFTKGIDRESARRHVLIEGDVLLAEPMLGATAIAS